MAQVLALLLAAALAAEAAPPPRASTPEKTYEVTVSPVPADKRARVAYFGPLIVFKALVGGQEVWAVLDSGAAKTAVDISLARELRLRVTDTEGAVNVPIVIPGQLSARYQRLPALDLSKAPGAGAGRKIGLVLGQDFLRGSAVSVDPANHAFELGPSGALTPPGAALIYLRSGQAGLTIGGEPARLTVDTGFEGQASLAPDAWGRFVPKTAVIGPPEGSQLATKSAKLPELSLGPASIGNVTAVDLPPSAAGADGSIGLGLLTRFLFTLDIGAGKLWISPLPANGS